MSEPHPPWLPGPADINSDERFLENGDLKPYRAMFNFLRLSPSYEKARREADEGAAFSGLPRDFDQVRQTYALLGDVRFTNFVRWWRERGFNAFGRKTGTVVIPVKIGAREDMLRQVSTYLDSHDLGGPLMKLRRAPRGDVIAKGLMLLWAKANQPELELWRLGTAVELSEDYAKELRCPNPPKYERDMMAKITGRELVNFESMAENAARGLFPADAPEHKDCFDWAEVKARMDLFHKWESDERIRYRAAPDSFV
ncbi:hypothetical protein ACQUZK_08995 [Streptococcus pyogenes]|uniref:hypothetical protein n=1 Tax=Streptococcus pyogenes TaxID=1314 RepID=UPI003DA02442